MQDGTTDYMIFDVPTLVRMISASIELLPGDVVRAGAPPGVGFARTPPVFLADGDDIDCSISGIGTLKSHVRITNSGQFAGISS
jgi:2,4-diketo-3-deoxy-L-fuconate hydrolase